MNCNCSMKINRASLYRNGQLITNASTSFITCKDNESIKDIALELAYNCCGNRLLVCSFIKNNEDMFINNAILRIKVSCINRCNCCSYIRCCNSCCQNGFYNNNCRCREFNLCNLEKGESKQICFNLNRCNCNFYYIEAEVIVNNEIVARESLKV